MKGKKYIAGLAATAMLVSLMAQTALANTDGGQKESEATVTYKASTETVPPINPEIPDKGGVPVPTDEGGGTAGPLSIDFVSQLDFGEQEITSSNRTYILDVPQKWKEIDEENNEEITDVASYAQVSDLRGKRTGWALYVEQTEPFTYQDITDEDDEFYQHEIENTTLTFKNLQINSEAKEDIWPSVLAENSDGEKALTIAAGTGKNMIMQAKANEGMGTYVVKYGAEEDDNILDSVELFVPGGSETLAGTYVTTLQWTLTDTPL